MDYEASRILDVVEKQQDVAKDWLGMGGKITVRDHVIRSWVCERLFRCQKFCTCLNPESVGTNTKLSGLRPS
jgi:hypothetical protein